MENLNIFLNYPNVFHCKYAAKGSTIAPISYGDLHNGSGPVVYDGKEQVPEGVLISWGTPGRKEVRSGYYYGRNYCDIAIRNIANKPIGVFHKTAEFEGIKHEIEVSSQHKISATTRGYYNSNRTKFARLVTTDSLNKAYLAIIKGLDVKFSKFVKDTSGWWLTTAPSTQNRTYSFDGRHRPSHASPKHLVDVTELMNPASVLDLNTALEQVTNELCAQDEMLAEYSLYTHEKSGFYSEPTAHVYRPRINEKDGEWQANARNDNYDRDWIMVPQTTPLTIKSWVSKDQQKIASEPIMTMEKDRIDLIQEFGFQLQEKKFDSIRVMAIFEWVCVDYAHDQQMRNNRHRNGTKYKDTTNYRVFLPKISGFCLLLKPKADCPPYVSVDTNQYGSVNVTRIEGVWGLETRKRVANRTKKRSVKGGYKGGYQGIEKLSLNKEVFLEHILVTGLQSFAKGAMIGKYKLERPKRIPLSLEQYQNIERPNVDVKPIEIGHLRFYRLSNPPKRQVTAEILSDLLLPSMPALLIATDTDVRVVSNSDTYQNGENCSGACDKQESIETTLPPGLYLVDRQPKCALGHDPGRKEYTSGFGDECNETITVRRLLSQFNVFYDQFRGNMVGQSSNSITSGSTVDNSAFLGRLG